MKVVCIDSSGLINPDSLLTVNKVYDVISVMQSDLESLKLYLLKDDRGINQHYKSERFVLLSTVRNEKLEKLLE